MSSPIWFDDPNMFGAWLGGLAGGIGGPIMGIIGWQASKYVKKGEKKILFVGLMTIFIVIGVFFLLCCLAALITSQPYGIWYPFLLCGSLYTGLTGWKLGEILREYKKVEELKNNDSPTEKIMPEEKTKAETKVFRWNFPGWFGVQIGGTVWLLAFAVKFFMTNNKLVATSLLLYFAISNVFGIILWHQRTKIKPYPALQMLIAVIGVFALLAVILLDVTNLLPILDPKSKNISYIYYLCLLVFPINMLVFHVRKCKAKRKQKNDKLKNQRKILTNSD